jgi:hypothetical protein
VTNEATPNTGASEVVTEQPTVPLKSLPPKKRAREIARRAVERQKAKRTRKNDVSSLTEQERDAITDRRTEVFLAFFERVEREGLDENDVAQISTFATTQYHVKNPVNQNLDDLGKLDVTPEAMTEYEYVAIVKKANFALNTVLQNRQKYVGGKVFWTNRHMKRATAKRILKGRDKARLLVKVVTVTQDKDGNETGRKTTGVVRTGTRIKGRGGARRLSCNPRRAVAEMKDKRTATDLVNQNR